MFKPGTTSGYEVFEESLEVLVKVERKLDDHVVELSVANEPLKVIAGQL